MTDEKGLISNRIEAMQRRMLTGSASARRKAYLAAAPKPKPEVKSDDDAETDADDDGADGDETS